MTENTAWCNQAQLMGVLVTELQFSHRKYGESFYTGDISVKRFRDSSDIIPVTLSERLLDVTQSYRGKIFQIEGQLRSCNRYMEGRNRLLLSVFASDVTVRPENTRGMEDEIYLDGYLCRKPVYRQTPLGRDIADIMLAVNRPYRKTDYIPCIVWGRAAKYSAGLDIGHHVTVWGRLQSRQYIKKLPSNAKERRIAYEVSVDRFEAQN